MSGMDPWFYTTALEQLAKPTVLRNLPSRKRTTGSGPERTHGFPPVGMGAPDQVHRSTKFQEVRHGPERTHGCPPLGKGHLPSPPLYQASWIHRTGPGLERTRGSPRLGMAREHLTKSTVVLPNLTHPQTGRVQNEPVVLQDLAQQRSTRVLLGLAGELLTRLYVLPNLTGECNGAGSGTDP